MRDDAIAALARSAVAAGRRRWPGIELDVEDLCADLQRRLGDLRVDRERWVADLYLAAACSRGNPRAIAAFEAAYFAEIERVLPAAYVRGRQAELEQLVRVKLFVGRSSGTAKIAQYRGIGSLRRWFRLVVRRTYLDARVERPASAEPVVAPPLDTPPGDVESAYFRYVYHREFAEAFAGAVHTLSRPERRLLYDHYVEGRTLDELASRAGIHRVTAARRIARARSSLRSSIVRCLRKQLSIESVDSIVRLLERQPPGEMVDFLKPTESTVSEP